MYYHVNRLNQVLKSCVQHFLSCSGPSNKQGKSATFQFVLERGCDREEAMQLRALLFRLICAGVSTAFQLTIPNYRPFVGNHFQQQRVSRFYAIDFSSLMDMDVVIYAKKDDLECKRIGALQEDGTLVPISAWSDEPVYGTSLEFVVDEEDRFPGLTGNDVVVIALIDPSSLSYGSRQVGGGKGPGNPHGEESELLYYVEQGKLTGVQFPVKPHLEILW